ncbi:MAG: lytic transglycosylase domain-containing protein [Vicinamibacterales bacterium]
MPQLLAAALALVLFAPAQVAVPPPPPEPFEGWLTALMAEARDRGYSDALIDEALRGLTPIERVVTQDRNQAETVLTFDRYYRSRVTSAVVRRGRELSRQYRTLLGRIERAYGVPRQVVLAIWGMETRYGRVTGNVPVFQSLATLAWEPRRAAFFRGELFNALTMVSSGSIDTRSMTGSWAGAMGQPQFMPSSYLANAVDFDGDGRRDIWNSVPDTLASIANYLRNYGWEEGITWGREVRVSAAARERLDVPRRVEGCTARRTMTEYRLLSEWQRIGLRRADGGPLPTADVYASFSELAESSYLLYPNYDTLLGYNCAHLYALSVAKLSDRLR